MLIYVGNFSLNNLSIYGSDTTTIYNSSINTLVILKKSFSTTNRKAVSIEITKHIIYARKVAFIFFIETTYILCKTLLYIPKKRSFENTTSSKLLLISFTHLIFPISLFGQQFLMTLLSYLYYHLRNL